MIRKITDGFKNIMKGLGTSKDPRLAVTYAGGYIFDQITANNLYVYDWLSRKVVNVPVEDATRKWRNLLISDAELKEEVEEKMKAYGVKDKVETAFKWARVFGGSVIIAIIDGQNPEEPLDIETIREGSLKRFLVLDRYNVYPEDINWDIMDENYGKPEHYTVVRGGQRIHHSRMNVIQGSTSTIYQNEQNNYWGESIFTSIYAPIKDSGVVSQSISALIYESNVDVYKIEGFNSMVAEGNDSLVVERLRIAHEMKSMLNGIVLDKNDEYDKKSNTFSNLSEIDDRFIQKVAGASNIPVTKLVGISPAGMNATGESDMLNYYDMVSGIQENGMRPVLDWVDSLILASTKFNMLESIDFEFEPLKQLTEIEQADVDLKNAQRDQIYLDLDVIRPLDVVAQLAEDGTYVTVDELRVNEEEELSEFEYEEPEIEGPENA